jgi:hypothetical protein
MVNDENQLVSFVKHDLKGVLKCIGVKNDPPPPATQWAARRKNRLSRFECK